MSAVLAPLLRHRWSRPVALAVDALLIVLLLWLLTRHLWLALDWNAPLPSADPVAVAEPAQAAPPPSLANWHLFGNAQLPSDPRTLANAPETTLPIDLRGVLAGDNPKQGRAIIADDSGERSVWVGREVAPGVVLDAVYPDRVALSRGGAIEVLKLRAPQAAGGASSAPVPTAARATQGATAMAAPNGSMATPSAPIDRTMFGQVTAPVQPMQGVDMEKVKQQLGVDPATLANQITPLPVMENGKFVGVRLNGGQAATVLQKLGLQADDVVTAINGIPVTDPSRIGAAVGSLSQSSHVEVAVRRNGKPQTITVELPH